MDFNKLVKENILPILLKSGFEISEEFKNILRFKSSKVEINIVSIDYENSNYIEIGKRGNVLYPLNDNAIKNIFNSELSINNLPIEEFIKNICLIFEQKEGNEILNGDIEPFITFSEKVIFDYNLELTQKQTLNEATKLWGNNDYKAFIASIDKLNFEKIPQSFQLKYKIAKRK